MFPSGDPHSGSSNGHARRQGRDASPLDSTDDYGWRTDETGVAMKEVVALLETERAALLDRGARIDAAIAALGGKPGRSASSAGSARPARTRRSMSAEAAEAETEASEA